MSKIEFDEEKSYLHSLPPEHTLPNKGIEGLMYKLIPGSVTFKRTVLIVFIILLFIISLLFAGLGRYNTEKDRIRNFENRAIETKI